MDKKKLPNRYIMVSPTKYKWLKSLGCDMGYFIPFTTLETMPNGILKKKDKHFRRGIK